MVRKKNTLMQSGKKKKWIYLLACERKMIVTEKMCSVVFHGFGRSVRQLLLQYINYSFMLYDCDWMLYSENPKSGIILSATLGLHWIFGSLHTINWKYISIAGKQQQCIAHGFPNTIPNSSRDFEWCKIFVETSHYYKLIWI